MDGRRPDAADDSIRVLFRFGTLGDLDDGARPERSLGDDHAAAEAEFEVLVRRHGLAVLRVGRRVLSREEVVLVRQPDE